MDDMSDCEDYVSVKTLRRCSEDDGGDGYQFKVATVMSVENVKHHLAEKKQLKSRSLECWEDPEPTRFQVKLSFGRDEEDEEFNDDNKNYLSAEFVVDRGHIRVGMCRINIFDDNLERICSDAIADDGIFVTEGVCGFMANHRLYSLENVGEVNWTVTCELWYDPVLHICCDSDPETETEVEKLSMDMHSLLENKTHADVKFFVERDGIVVEMKAHKLILVTRSAYFQKLFHSGMKESVSKVIKIEESPALFSKVLKFIYTGQPPKGLRNFAMELLPVADRFGLDKLKEMCASALKQEISKDSVIDILLLADTLHLPALLRYCIPFFQAHVKNLESGIHWIKLDDHPHLLKKLLVYCCE